MREIIMKRKTSLFIVSLFMMLAVIWPQATNVKAANNLTQVQINVKFNQSEARSMLPMINNFRAGNWWIWNGDGTKYYGKGLPALKYDYNLEKIAMVRAAELAIRTDHLRPNDSYVFEIDGVFGENIAWGQTSAKQVYTQWLEENAKSLSGQGHRYNMLSHVCIGIGHAIYNGKHYWVQEFSDYDLTSDYTQPFNSNINVNVDVTDAVLKKYAFKKDEL